MAVSKYSVVESGNLGLGQAGSIFLDTGSAPSSPPTGLVFVAITFLADTTLAASGGLVAEDSSLYPNTAAAAHDLGSGSATTLEGEGGIQVDASNTFPKGITIYGRWTGIKIVTSGLLIAYIAK